MTQSHPRSVTFKARRQMHELARAGWEAYEHQQFVQASDCYDRAAAIADSIGDLAARIEYRYWSGDSLAALGKLRQALAVLTPSLQEPAAAHTSAHLYNTLLAYISVAQLIPTSLQSIISAHEQTERLMRDTGKMQWRHKLLALQAELHSIRGMYREALHAAQESWAQWRDEYPSFIADVHFSILVHAGLNTGDSALAQRYVAEWEQHPDQRPTYREPALCLAKARLARMNKEFYTAAALANQAHSVAQQSNNSRRNDAKEEQARTYLSMGEPARAAPLLRQLLALRHEENGHLRYNVQLLRGDYHLACARAVAGISPADDADDQEFPLPERVAYTPELQHMLVQAQRAYTAALSQGRIIDTRLECQLRQVTIERRVAYIAEIRGRMGNG